MDTDLFIRPPPLADARNPAGPQPPRRSVESALRDVQLSLLQREIVKAFTARDPIAHQHALDALVDLARDRPSRS
jgi:hypothetical protein